MRTAIKARWNAVRQKLRRADVARALKQTPLPSTKSAESQFDQLQANYAGVPEYGYDRVSNWRRGCERAQQLIDVTKSIDRDLRILEVGCGDGMTGCLLQTFGHTVALTDMEDWRDPRAKHLGFLATTLEQGLPFDECSFDMAYSYNTFEHLSDPTICLRHVLRVLKPGGLVFLEFGPLYASPWGLHAYRTLKMPYPQWLFSEDFILNKLRELGVRDLGKERTELQPLNRWRLADFQRLWRTSECELVSEDDWRNEQFLDLILRYPEAFSGRGLTVEDIATAGLRVLLKKR